MVRNSQRLYWISFTFNGIIIIRQYIYSHSTNWVFIQKYVYLHFTAYFLFKNIFTHIYGLYSFAFPIEILVQHDKTFSAHPLRIVGFQHPLFSEHKMADEGIEIEIVTYQFPNATICLMFPKATVWWRKCLSKYWIK